MQPKTYFSQFKSLCFTVAATLSFATSSIHAGQYNFTDPISSTGNNFSMIAAGGGVSIGGTNDVVFNWDGTLNDAVAGAVSNATISSDEAFFGALWSAHDVTMYGPGTYEIYDGCDPGDAGCGVGNKVTLNVGTNQVGAHMLFDWPTGSDPVTKPNNTNIDIVILWNFNTTWSAENPMPANPFHNGLDNGISCTSPTGGPACTIDGLPNTDTTTFNFVSIDVGGNGIAGNPMTDGAFVDANANFNFNGIVIPNAPPTANDFSVSTTTTTLVTIDLADKSSNSDGTVDPATIAIVAGPGNGTIKNNGDGTVDYTPNAGTGTPFDSFDYTIDDNAGDTSNTATVTINVNTVANNTPVAADTGVNADEDTSLDIAVTSVATDDDGDTLTFQFFDATSTDGGTVTANAANNILTYTPATDYFGTDLFTFWVTDGLDSSNKATITITVSAVNEPPVCTDVSLSTGVDTQLDIDINEDLLSTCSDTENDHITLESFSQPSMSGSYVLEEDVGTLTYTPAMGFNGIDSFTYTASDEKNTDTRTVFIDHNKVFGNFTMLDADGVTFGGTNDIVAEWDGSLNNDVTDTNFNMTMGSVSNHLFFGFPWTAHDIRMFGPGTYMFDTSCSVAQIHAGLADCGGAPEEFLTLTVGAGQIGAHMLLDWNVSDNIDVVNLYEANAMYTNPDPRGQLYRGDAGPTPELDCVFEYASVDGDGDTVPGVRFIDGPFIDFRANFSLNFNRGCVDTILVDVSGTIKTANNLDICAMVLASGQFMFSCNPNGVFSLTSLPREKDGTVKRQIYADGFFPKIDILTGTTDEAVVMTRSGVCPKYSAPSNPAFVPDSAGKRINITGKVLLQNSQTPICAMVLANGQYMFTCDGSGNYALNIPLDINGQYKLQVYADGFAPITQKFDEFSVNNDVRMARAVECQ